MNELARRYGFDLNFPAQISLAVQAQFPTNFAGDLRCRRFGNRDNKEQ